MQVTLANAFVRRRYDVDLVLVQARGVLFDDLDPRVRVIDLAAPRLAASLRPLVGYLRARRPDVLLAAMWPLTVVAVVANRLAGSPASVMLSEHSILSLAPANAGPLKQLVLRQTVRYFYPLADRAIAVSKGVAADLARLGGIAPENIAVIHNPIGGSGYTAYRRHGGVCPDPWGRSPGKRILSVGNLKPVKDHRTLIHAFARVRERMEATLAVVGEGPLRPQLERLVEELGLTRSVVLPGYVPEPRPWYEGADVFALSSVNEGFGNVLVEALQLGLPVVSTDCPSGPREILCDGEFGALVPVGDPDAMASALVDALSREHDGRALRERADEFTIDRIADQYLDVLLGASSSGS